MDENKRLPKRKSTRLKYYDYSSAGAYFVTICVNDRKPLLSEIIKTSADPLVGEGLAPPVTTLSNSAVGEGLAPPAYSVKLKPCGVIAEEQLKQIEIRFPSVSVDDFVIMPDHIHALIFLHKNTGGASPSPTLNDVICAFKSLTSRICKKQYGIEKMFQRSFSEHIVRDQDDYVRRKNYMHKNPARWYYDELNPEDK